MESTSNFSLYIVGFMITVAGAAIGAHLLGAPLVWVGVGVMVATGVGIVRAISTTQSRAVPSDSKGTIEHRIED